MVSPLVYLLHSKFALLYLPLHGGLSSSKLHGSTTHTHPLVLTHIHAPHSSRHSTTCLPHAHRYSHLHFHQRPQYLQALPCSLTNTTFISTNPLHTRLMLLPQWTEKPSSPATRVAMARSSQSMRLSVHRVVTSGSTATTVRLANRIGRLACCFPCCKYGLLSCFLFY